MATPEQNFWKLIKKHLPGDVSRIENIADNGTPDVSGACGGQDYWIELKIYPNKLSKEQKVWHLRRMKQGSLIFTITYYPKRKPKLIKMHVYLGDVLYVSNFKSVCGKFNWERFNEVIIKILKGKNIWFT